MKKTEKNEKATTDDEEMSNCYSMEEIMNILECSRYKVMKYYSEEGLPLRKYKNKYCIDKIDLYNWIQQKIKEAKERRQIAILVGLIIFVVTILIIKFLVL